MNNQNHVIEILKRTFEVLDRIYKFNDESVNHANLTESKSRLIFPRYSTKYRNGLRRVSEQELRFAFIEQFNKYCDENTNWDVFYSVETPTEEKYKFSGVPEPIVVNEGEVGGQSAMIDTTIHDNTGKRLCIIEFKANNPESFCYRKDLVKLNAEIGSGFFVQIIENENSGTIPNILDKVDNMMGSCIFVCHNLANTHTYYKSSPNIEIDGWEKK